MAINYTMNWTDSTLKQAFTLNGGTIDNTTTSLSLTGKGALNWGESIQENILHVMENFASANAPSYATIGQTWYNSSSTRLSVNSSTGWKELAFRRIDSSSQPTGTHFPGDQWYDTANNLLKVYTNDGTWAYFMDGPGSPGGAGSAYTSSSAATGSTGSTGSSGDSGTYVISGYWDPFYA